MRTVLEGHDPLVASLPTVATNEGAEISLPPVASLLPAVSLPTVATEMLAVSLPTVATDPNLQFATVAKVSGSAGTSSNEGPRSLAVSDSLVNSRPTEIRIDHHIDDDNDGESVNSYRSIDGLAESNSSSKADSSESSRSCKKSKKRSRSASHDCLGNSEKPTSQRSNSNCE